MRIYFPKYCYPWNTLYDEYHHQVNSAVKWLTFNNIKFELIWPEGQIVYGGILPDSVILEDEETATLMRLSHRFELE